MKQKNRAIKVLIASLFLASITIFNLSKLGAFQESNNQALLRLKIVTAKLGCSFPIQQNPLATSEPNEMHTKVWLAKLASEVKSEGVKQKTKSAINKNLLRIPDKSFEILWKNLTNYRE